MKFTVNSDNKQQAVFHKLLVAIFLVGSFLLGGQTVLAVGYYEYQNPPCYDITGKTTALLVGGVNNGGIMDFDDTGVDPLYQACVRMTVAGPTGVPSHLEGWVWNDNLGWVSMYCPASGLNMGRNCGVFQYSVTFNPLGGSSPDFGSVSMFGSAWGDNIGYISFNSGVHQMKPIPNGLDRGLVDPSSPMDQKYAWADSVGWLDYSGVKFRWEAEPVVPQPDDVQILNPDGSCDLADVCVPTVDKAPVGDANDNYTIEIPFKDGAVDLTDLVVADCGVDSIGMYTQSPTGKPYCARVKLEWEDTVDYNQTTFASQNSHTPLIYATTTAPGGPGAVIKPVGDFNLYGANFVYNAVKKIWGADVKSYAPTSDMNIADGMPLEKFNYVEANRLDANWQRDKYNENRLQLAKANLMLFKYSTGAGIPGSCIMGDILDPNPIAPPNPYTCNLHTYIEDINMPFKPLVEVTKLVHSYLGKELNYFNIDNVEEPQNFLYTIAKNGVAGIVGFNAKFDIGLEADPNYALKFSPSDAVDISVLSDSTSGAFVANLTSGVPGVSFSSNAGPYLFSKISYSLLGKPVSYFSNKLPRIVAGILKNPVALVQGNVYLTDFAKKASDVTLRSLGNISSNLRREEITRNVNKYLRGYETTLVTGHKTVDNGLVENINNLNELVTDKVFYLKGYNLTIDCGTVCAFNRNVTFIVENGNIFVNSNIQPVPGVQVGLIALRNLDGNVKNQGFLYVDKNVTWLSHVQIYLDRVMQSYDKEGALMFDANGFFTSAGGDSARQTLFKNQLVFEGTLSSMNGIGNASATPPNDEEGNVVAASSCVSYGNPVTGICRARVTDLNYMRYYGPGLEICTGGEGVGAPYPPLVNVPRDQKLRSDSTKGFGCNPDPATGYEIDATTLFDENLWGDLVGGGEAGGTHSPYFDGKQASLKTQFPVNFFYVPISPDLAGFEQEQEFNPLIQ